MTLQPTVNLTNCDREPIQIPGSIQPHGCLLALSPGGEEGAVALARAVALEEAARPNGARMGRRYRSTPCTTDAWAILACKFPRFPSVPG